MEPSPPTVKRCVCLCVCVLFGTWHIGAWEAGGVWWKFVFPLLSQFALQHTAVLLIISWDTGFISITARCWWRVTTKQHNHQSLHWSHPHVPLLTFASNYTGPNQFDLGLMGAANAIDGFCRWSTSCWWWSFVLPMVSSLLLFSHPVINWLIRFFLL